MAKIKDDKITIDILNKELEKLYRVHNRYDVIKDFIKLSAISLYNSTEIPNLEVWRKNEEEYLNTIKNYSTEEMEIIVKCLSYLIKIIDDDVKNGIYKDWIGDLYMQSGTSSRDKGQFFTPYSVGKLMAEMNLKDIDQLKNKEVITINDPCVGGGCLPIAMCEVLKENGINYQNKALIFADDNDERCFYMTYIQLALIGCPARIQLKDTILNKNLGKTWDTPLLKLQYRKFKPYLEI